MAGMGVPYLPDRFGQPAPLFDYAMKDVWTAIEELKSLATKKFEALEEQGAEMKTMMKTLVSLQSTACPSSTPMTNESSNITLGSGPSLQSASQQAETVTQEEEPRRGPPLVSILSKRPRTEADTNEEDGDLSGRVAKRVRFVDTEDIPLPYIQSPSPQLDVGSDIREAITPTNRPAGFTDGDSTLCEPATSAGSQHFSDCENSLSPPNFSGHSPCQRETPQPEYSNVPLLLRISPFPRRKTKWDPTSGRRIPIRSNMPDILEGLSEDEELDQPEASEEIAKVEEAMNES